MRGLIIENVANLYRVKILEDDEKKICQTNPEPIAGSCQLNPELMATARGKFKKDDISPVVGDLVELEMIENEYNKAVIDKILPRKVYVKRPKLANITQLVFVVSSKDPKPDLLMLDKQLAFAEFLGINAIIVLNKTDLDSQEQFQKIKQVYENIGYKVILSQAKEGKGINELKNQLKNNVNAFSGNSGVGKSTLINGIFKYEVTQEGEISKKNKKGKNTTTAIKLYEIDDNTFIADTPGFSTFDILEIEYKNLENYFREFKQYMKDCKFVGCTHIKEQSCGIKQALEEGKISQERYERFCKIYQELKQKEEYKKW